MTRIELVNIERVLAFPWTFVKGLEGPELNDDDIDPGATLSSIAWMDDKNYVLASAYGSQGIRFALFPLIRMYYVA